MGDPGSETWPNQDAMHHGGGMTWMPGTYDPDLNLLYWGTGNANPVFAGQGRKGSNLWTASIVALNPDTGKLAWYFQASPHDTHDWDNVETPVLFDATINGQAAQAAGAGGAGWMVLRSGPYEREEPGIEAVFRYGKLGAGRRRERGSRFRIRRRSRR